MLLIDQIKARICELARLVLSEYILPYSQGAMMAPIGQISDDPLLPQLFALRYTAVV